jgi:hypothetical protein
MENFEEVTMKAAELELGMRVDAVAKKLGYLVFDEHRGRSVDSKTFGPGRFSRFSGTPHPTFVGREVHDESLSVSTRSSRAHRPLGRWARYTYHSSHRGPRCGSWEG